LPTNDLRALSYSRPTPDWPDFGQITLVDGRNEARQGCAWPRPNDMGTT